MSFCRFCFHLSDLVLSIPYVLGKTFINHSMIMKGCLSMFPFLVSHVFKIIPYFAMQLYVMKNGKCLGSMGYGGFFSFRGILYYFIF